MTPREQAARLLALWDGDDDRVSQRRFVAPLLRRLIALEEVATAARTLYGATLCSEVDSQRGSCSVCRLGDALAKADAEAAR